MSKKFALTAVVAAALAFPALGQEAQKSPAKKRLSDIQSASVTATVQSIDSAKRELTLKTTDGETVVMEVPQSVERFPAIKVGDQLNVKYREALVLDVHKADPSAKLGVSAERGIERKPGEKPSGIISQQVTATVAIEAIDPKTPAVTIRTGDGDKISFHVKNPKNLEGVSVGDKVVITYQEAVAIDVSAPPAK